MSSIGELRRRNVSEVGLILVGAWLGCADAVASPIEKEASR